MRYYLFLCCFLSLISLEGCNNDDDFALVFVGDSQIANWDTEYYFPNRITKNYGRDGAMLDDLLGQDAISERDDVIIEIGTNDIKHDWDESQIDEYAKNYVTVLKTLHGRRKYVMDVFPTLDKERNNVIKVFNDVIDEIIRKEENIEHISVYDLLEDDGVIKDDLTRDGIHLNDFGYLIITNKIKKEI